MDESNIRVVKGKVEYYDKCRWWLVSNGDIICWDEYDLLDEIAHTCWCKNNAPDEETFKIEVKKELILTEAYRLLRKTI